MVPVAMPQPFVWKETFGQQTQGLSVSVTGCDRLAVTTCGVRDAADVFPAGAGSRSVAIGGTNWPGGMLGRGGVWPDTKRKRTHMLETALSL